jgi:carbonic anhydrase
MSKMGTFFNIRKEDVPASLVVFLVAVPLSLGIGIASGVSAESALIAAVVGGVVVGLLSGAPLMVSGPAAGLTVLVYQTVEQYGPLALAVIVVACGLFQVIFGYLKAGSLFTLVPFSMLHGMLAAIGFIILLGQMHVLVGEHIPNTPFKAMEMLWPSLQQGLSHEIHIITPVFLCGLLAIFLQVIWPRVFPRLKWIPGALPAVVIVTLISLFWEMDRLYVENLIPLAREGFGDFFTLWWLKDDIVLFMSIGLGFTLVASAESLLTARATDVLVRERNSQDSEKSSDLNRELIAQGAGNITSGILGGLPLTGVIVRSSANVDAGAKTRWSAVLHGSWILLFILLAPVLLSKIPLTVLASILVVTGVKLLKFREMMRTFRTDRVDGMIWIFTLLAIISTNLLTGLALALAFAIVIKLTEIHVPWAEGIIWLFGIGAVLITNVVTGLALAVAFVLALVLFSIDVPRLIKKVKANPKNLRRLWRQEPS